MKIILEDCKDGMRVRIWDGRREPAVDRVVGARLAVRIIDAVKGLLNTYGGFDRYGR